MPMVKKKEILCSLQLLAILNRPDIYWQISLSVDFIIKLFYTNYARAKLILSMSTIVHTDFDWLLRLQRPSGKQSLDCIPPSLKCQQTDVMLAPCTAPRRAFKCTQTWRSAHKEGNPCPDFRVFLLTRRNIQWPCHLHVRLSVYQPPCAKFQKQKSQHLEASPLVLRKCTHREMHLWVKTCWKSATLSWNLQVGLLCTSACIAELGFQLRSLEQPMGR